MEIIASLLSFLSPSYMPERISVNTLFPFDINPDTNCQESSTRMAINMEVDTSRGQSVSSSANSSRSASVLSNASSKAYVEWVQALANSPAWADQVENEKFQTTPLSYSTAKEGENDSTNQVPNVDLNHDPLEAAPNNSCPTQGLEPSVLPTQPTNLRIVNYGTVTFVLYRSLA